VLSLAAERYLDPSYAPEAAAGRCGVPAETIRRIAREMAHVAFRETITLDIPWTDAWGHSHDQVVGRPVSMYAMRGVSAHSNGFQTCRALHLIQMLLGALEGPGNFRARAPYPRPVPPPQLPANARSNPRSPLGGTPLGFPTRPEDLALDADGSPLRLDKAYSWESPLAAHGLMHMVIANAVAGDPYPIDTLILFMANMAWNSAMNTSGTREMLRAKDCERRVQDPVHRRVRRVPLGDRRVRRPRAARHDLPRALRRDQPARPADLRARRARRRDPPPDPRARPRRAAVAGGAGRARLAPRLPAFTKPDGSRRYKDYRDFIVRYEKMPGVGFLAGWRGADGKKSLVGEPNAQQWERYVENQSFFAFELPPSLQWHRHANQRYLEFAKRVGFTIDTEPIVMQLWSEPLQRFRLAGQGRYDGPRPSDPADAARLAEFFDPLPDWHAPLEIAATDGAKYPFHAITQRPMAMYHSWDAQNAWLRQIVAENALYMNTRSARERGLADGDWVWVVSPLSRVRCRLKTMEGTEPHTVWTWNAIGKQAGAWGLDKHAPEAQAGFLLNHLIAEHLPTAPSGRRYSNSDPVTGQAAWFDLRVDVVKCAPGEEGTWPLVEPLATRRRGARRAALDRAMKLGLVIDLDTCVGCHACATACKEWNGASADRGPADRQRSLRRRPERARGSTGSATTRSARSRTARRSTCRCRACTARTPRA
jgi:anaerobic selenocysteine-containing dehydrogenase/ferredoxin